MSEIINTEVNQSRDDSRLLQMETFDEGMRAMNHLSGRDKHEVMHTDPRANSQLVEYDDNKSFASPK